jgi:hypothetical protein
MRKLKRDGRICEMRQAVNEAIDQYHIEQIDFVSRDRYIAGETEA